MKDSLSFERRRRATCSFCRLLLSGGPLTDDHVVRLDDAHSMPAAAHSAARDLEKLFTLSNTGFYMLVLKLSIHFCRLQEKVNRV